MSISEGWPILRIARFLSCCHLLTTLSGVNAALQIRHGSAAAFESQESAKYPATPAHPAFSNENNLEYRKRDNDFCWPLIDTKVATQVFCQCSDYVVRPIITQAPTPGLAYGPCAAYNATTTTSVDSNHDTGETTSKSESSSTSTRTLTTTSSSKSSSRAASSSKRSSAKSSRSTLTTISSKAHTTSTSSKQRKGTTSSVRTSTRTVSSKASSSQTSARQESSTKSGYESSKSSKSSSHASATVETQRSRTSTGSPVISQTSSSSRVLSLQASAQAGVKSSSSHSTLTRTVTSNSSSNSPTGINSVESGAANSTSSTQNTAQKGPAPIIMSSARSLVPGAQFTGNPQNLIGPSSVTPNVTADSPSSPSLSSTPITTTANSTSPVGWSVSPTKQSTGCHSRSSTLPAPESSSSGVLNRRADEIGCDSQLNGAITNVSSTAETIDGHVIHPSVAHNPDKNGTYMLSNATSEQESQCQDFGTHQFQACWEVLNVTGFITDWVAYNQEVCNTKTMGFADCFLNLETKAGVNCSDFTALSQCPTPNARDFSGRKHGAQIYYVAFNIWNIQNWFHTYWQALTGANGLTADNIAAVCRLLQVTEPKGFPWNEVLSVMAFALGLISPSGWGSKLPALGSGLRNALTKTQVPGEYLLRAVQGSPTLTRNLLASGQLSKVDVQIGAINSNLATIVSQLETNVQNAIVDAMGNFSLFMEFANEGFFSTQIQNINTIQQNLTQALNTYVVSQALQDDLVIITRALDTDVHALATNGTELGYDINCKNGYDEWGMCDVWWYDTENNISYGLESLKDMALNFTDVLHDLFNSNVTTPQMLFQGSQVCANAAGGIQGDAPGSNLTTKTGIWNAECIANLKICTWELGELSQEKEFTDCPGETDFALEGCGFGTENEALVPINYLGPWILGGYEGIVCNKLPPGSMHPE